ncbi:VWA domain-containing protein [bacterium]|nr:VWA domain-containing protein [bacterium]
MNWLAPTFAAGLLLATLPILIHLLGRRRLKRQPFPTLEFLRRLQVKRMRKLRIRQWILLALRTLAVLLLATAFLRPFLEASGSGSGGGGDVVLLIDESASMEALRPSGTPLEQMRKSASTILSAHAGGRVAVVFARSDESEDIPWQPITSESPPWLKSLEASGRHDTAAEALYRVNARLSESNAARRYVYWLSDFTSPPPDSLPAQPEHVTTVRISLADRRDVVNASILSVEPEKKVLRPDQPVTLLVTSRLTGAAEPVEGIVTIRLDGRRVAEGAVTLQPEKTQEARFTFLPTNTGRLQGEVELEFNDALSLDNRHAFVMDIPAERSVLLLSPDPKARRLVSLALASGRNRHPFRVTRAESPAGKNLDAFDMIFLADTPALRMGESRRLLQAVQNGTGLWILAGERFDPAFVNRALLEPMKMGTLLPASGRGRVQRSWQDLDRTHPVIDDLLEEALPEDLPVLHQWLPLQIGEEDRVLVRLEDGAPFLVESAYGEGRVWITPAGIDTMWGDWAYTGVFAPLVQSGAAWLSSNGQIDAPTVYCGEPLYWDAGRDADPSTPPIVEDPRGNRLPVQYGVHAGRARWISTATDWPGHYLLVPEDPSASPRPGSAVIHPAEGELSTKAEQFETVDGTLIAYESREQLGVFLDETRKGRELRWELLAAALLFLLAESVLARDSRRAATEQTAGSGA